MVSSSRGTTVSKQLNMDFNMNVNKSDQAWFQTSGPRSFPKLVKLHAGRDNLNWMVYEQHVVNHSGKHSVYLMSEAKSPNDPGPENADIVCVQPMNLTSNAMLNRTHPVAKGEA